LIPKLGGGFWSPFILRRFPHGGGAAMPYMPYSWSKYFKYIVELLYSKLSRIFYVSKNPRKLQEKMSCLSIFSLDIHTSAWYKAIPKREFEPFPRT
jgi:hypothetical protein